MLKRFVAYYRPHLFLFTIDMVCAFLIAGIDLFFPSFTKKALDQYIPQRDLRGLITVSIVLGILFLFRAFFTYVVNSRSSRWCIMDMEVGTIAVAIISTIVLGIIFWIIQKITSI